MPSIEPLIQHASPFLLALFRLSGLFIWAPMLSSTVIPARVRTLVAIVLTLAIYPCIPTAASAAADAHTHTLPSLDLASLAPAIVAETLIGLSIGLLASLPMFAVQMAGQIMGQQTGLSLGGVFNPALDVETDAISQLLMSIALGIFIAVGGLETLFLSVAATFTTIPLGGASLTAAPLDLFLGLLSAGGELALRVAAPVVCILLVETIVSGLLMKTIPQINIMSMGYGIKVLLAFIVLLASLYSVVRVVGDDVEETLGAVTHWAQTLTVPSSPSTPMETR